LLGSTVSRGHGALIRFDFYLQGGAKIRQDHFSGGLGRRDSGFQLWYHTLPRTVRGCPIWTTMAAWIWLLNLLHHQNLPTDVRRMHLADVGVEAGSPRRKLYGGLRLGLHNFFDTESFKFEAMGQVEFIDQGEFHLIALLDDEARWQPDLGVVEDDIDQGELFRLGCGW
jgi:hypothetical protein